MNEKLLEYFHEVEKKHWWWEGRRQVLRQNISQKENLKILDLGCGTGETLSFLKNYLKHPQLYGVDNSPNAIKFAQKRGHKNITNVNALTLPFKDKTFDYVLILDVIEHIKDDAGLLREVRRVLKDNGKVIVTSPALQFIWSEHDTGQGHYRRYTRRMMNSVAQEAKLKVNKIGYFNFFLSPAIILVRLLGKLKPFKKYNEYNSNLNYDIVKNTPLNNLLKTIFVTEVKLSKYISYPFGISIYSVFRK